MHFYYSHIITEGDLRNGYRIGWRIWSGGGRRHTNNSEDELKKNNDKITDSENKTHRTIN